MLLTYHSYAYGITNKFIDAFHTVNLISNFRTKITAYDQTSKQVNIMDFKPCALVFNAETIAKTLDGINL